MTPMRPTNLKRRTSLARLATLFAATFILSLGACGLSMHLAGRDYPNLLGFLSLIGMLVSLVALIVIGCTALARIDR